MDKFPSNEFLQCLLFVFSKKSILQAILSISEMIDKRFIPPQIVRISRTEPMLCCYVAYYCSRLRNLMAVNFQYWNCLELVIALHFLPLFLLFLRSVVWWAKLILEVDFEIREKETNRFSPSVAIEVMEDWLRFHFSS